MESLYSVVGAFLDWNFKTLLLFFVIVVVTADYFKNRRPVAFPPGPWGLPIVGNIFSVDNNKAHESLTQYAGKYGNVYSIRMGQTWMVVLNGLDVLKEGLITQADSMIDRPEVPLLVEIFHKRDLFSGGNTWRQQRRFALSSLRHFGFGRKSLEQVILDEFTICAAYFSKYKGSPFNPQHIVTYTISNIICSIVFGHRFEYSDEKFVNLINLFDEAFMIQESVWAKLYNSFPEVMKLFPGPHQTYIQTWESVKDFIREEIHEHKKTWDPSEPRDFIDSYLNEIEMNKKKNDDIFTEESLVVMTVNLFSAGTETTATTIRWAFLYMVKYPEIQEKVQAEIARVIGHSRQPSCDDRTNMPYTNAVIHEIQRISNIVPLSVVHATSREVQLRGYTIPKGTVIIPNLTSVLFEENEWETPNTFNPGHFLNKEGEFVKRAAFLPFSAGKRACLGENLAKMELFLFFTSFIQQFTFSMPAGVKPVMDYRFGITLSPQQYEICAQSCSN